MYEIDLSTLMLIGIDDETTKIVDMNEEKIVKESCRQIVNNSCKFFGSTLTERIKISKRLVKLTSKAPIIVEESKNIIFFPLRSVREKNNIWISYNNLVAYEKNGLNTILKFKNGKNVEITFSYYIIDNQVTRSLMLDYEITKRQKSLEKK